MLTVLIIIAVAALVCTILAALPTPKLPIWVAVLLLCAFALLQVIPLGR